MYLMIYVVVNWTKTTTLQNHRGGQVYFYSDLENKVKLLD